MFLSKNFTLRELTLSQTAERHGIDNSPPETAIRSLQNLAGKILQPLRDYAGSPIHVSSGYRCPALNAQLVGSSRSSAHMFGRAADIVSNSVSTLSLAQFISNLVLPFDQLILEYYVPGFHFSGWVHVAIADFDSPPRGQILLINRHSNGYREIDARTLWQMQDD